MDRKKDYALRAKIAFEQSKPKTSSSLNGHFASVEGYFSEARWVTCKATTTSASIPWKREFLASPRSGRKKRKRRSNHVFMWCPENKGGLMRTMLAEETLGNFRVVRLAERDGYRIVFKGTKEYINVSTEQMREFVSQGLFCKKL